MTLGATLTYEDTGRTIDIGHSMHLHEAGDGPALVLLHGSGPGVSGWSNFEHNLPVFAERFRTIIIDMPGFGESELPELDRVYPEVAAASVRSCLDALDIERAHVIGNSMGGWVATTLALDAPDRVDRLVLMGPGGLAASIFSDTMTEGARRLFEFIATPSRDGMEAWVDTMVVDRTLISDELIERRFAAAMAPGALDRARRIFASLNDPTLPVSTPLWARAGELTHRTLVTWGRDDRMVPFEMGIFAFGRFANAELHVFSRCGHWAQVERKQEFERVVQEFLTRL